MNRLIRFSMVLSWSFVSLSSLSAVFAAEDFVEVLDQHGDDGSGRYLYPSTITTKAADIRKLVYQQDAEFVTFEVSMAAITPETRIGISLINQAAYSAEEIDFTIGGTELRIPYWNGNGLNLIVADPDSSLFDHNVRIENPIGQPRPDNAIYVKHDPTLWLGGEGNEVSDARDVLRLDVSVERSGVGGDRFIIRLPKTVVSSILNPRSGIYAAFYSYLTTESSAVEYGAFEINSDLGGFVGWEDCDVYDILGLDQQEQFQLLAPKPDLSGLDATVVLRSTDDGFVFLPYNP